MLTPFVLVLHDLQLVHTHKGHTIFAQSNGMECRLLGGCSAMWLACCVLRDHGNDWMTRGVNEYVSEVLMSSEENSDPRQV